MTNEKLSRLCLKGHKKSSYFVINQNKSFMYSFYIRELSVLFSDKQINNSTNKQCSFKLKLPLVYPLKSS